MNLFKQLKNLKKKLGRKFWIILGIIALVVIGVIVRSRKNDFAIETAKVTKGEIVESISTSGRVAATQHADLTFLSGGRVAWVNVKEGDWVRKYQGIATLDTVLLSVAYQQSLNNYKSLDAAAKKAEDDVKGHEGDETFTQKATRTAAQVARDNAYDSMTAAKHALDLATITAPFDGLITEATPSYSGINVNPGSARYTLINPLTTYFEVEVEESDLPSIKIGQKAKLSLDAYPDEVFDGEVKSIGFVATVSSTGGNAYKVKVTLPKNIDLKFKLGMEGDVDIVFSTTTDVLKVPSSSIISEEGKDFVFAVENGVLKKTEVTTGAESIDEIEIKSGLSEGVVVVNTPTKDIKDGQKVNLTF